MLSDDDQQLVDRDASLTGLGFLLDRQAVARAWAEFAGTPFVPTGSLRYLRYKPGRRCVAMYEFESGDARDTIVAIAHNTDGWRKHLATHDMFSSACDPSASNEFSHHHVAFVKFPYDRRLRILASLDSNSERHEWIRRRLPDATSDDDLQLTRLAYKPYRRAVYRARLNGTDVLTLKCYDKAHFAKAKRCATGWADVAGDLLTDGIIVPTLTRADRKRRVLLMEWIEGASCDCLTESSEMKYEDLFRIGRALSVLHAARSSISGTATSSDSGTWSRAAEDLRSIAPEFASRADRLVTSVKSRLSLCRRDPVWIHGDCDASQVVMQSNRIGLIDFDRSMLGQPLQDLGNFVAKLVWRPGRLPQNEQTTASSEVALLEGYFSTVRSEMCRDLDTYVAAALLGCATDPFRIGMTDWRREIDRLLKGVEDRIGVSEPRSTLIVPNVSAIDASTRTHVAGHEQRLRKLREDLSGNWIEGALDRHDAVGRITKSIPQFAGLADRLSVDGIDVLRYKPGRRCLIRYDLRIAQSQSADHTFSVLGKVRVKGVDRHGYEVQRQLRAAGFDGRTHHGIAVPATLGIDPTNRIWYQSCVAGTCLDDIVMQGDSELFPHAGQRTAEALRCLHDTEMPAVSKHYTVEEEIASLVSRLHEVALTRPELQQAIGQLVAITTRVGERIVDSGQCGIHRDFYPAQVLVTADQLHLVDFDLYCRGPALLDVGNFLAHLWEASIRFPQHCHRWFHTATTFADHYLESSHRRLHDRQQIEYWTWVSFARHVWISSRIPNRSWATAQIVQAALAHAPIHGWHTTLPTERSNESRAHEPQRQ